MKFLRFVICFICSVTYSIGAFTDESTVVIRDLKSNENMLTALAAQYKSISTLVLTGEVTLSDPQIKEKLKPSDVTIQRCNIPSPPSVILVSKNIAVACKDLTTDEFKKEKLHEIEKLIYIRGKSASESRESSKELNKCHELVQIQSAIIINKVINKDDTFAFKTFTPPDTLAEPANIAKPADKAYDYPEIPTASSQQQPPIPGADKSKAPKPIIVRLASIDKQHPSAPTNIQIYSGITPENQKNFLEEISHKDNTPTIILSVNEVLSLAKETPGLKQVDDRDGMRVNELGTELGTVKEYVISDDNTDTFNLDKLIKAISQQKGQSLTLVADNPEDHFALLLAISFIEAINNKQFISVLDAITRIPGLSPNDAAAIQQQNSELSEQLIQYRAQEGLTPGPDQKFNYKSFDVFKDLTQDPCASAEYIKLGEKLYQIPTEDKENTVGVTRVKALAKAMEKVLSSISGDRPIPQITNVKRCKLISRTNTEIITLTAGQMWGRETKNASIKNFISTLQEKKYISRLHLMVKEDYNGDLVLHDFSRNGTVILNEDGMPDNANKAAGTAAEAASKNNKSNTRFSNKGKKIPKNGGFILGDQKILCQDIESGNNGEADEKLKQRIGQILDGEEEKQTRKEEE
ncbi:MAG: hypothetical protein HQK50_14160 [Oligoflexia bacterium]|nr:hypothetical protein [Oligoflexia bacterium]